MRPPDRLTNLHGNGYCESCRDYINEKPSRRRNLLLSDKLVMRAARMRCEPTKAEALLWAELRSLPGWHTQEPLIFYIADFLHVPTSTIIELDGKHHHGPENMIKDAVRTGELRSKGYYVVRFDNDEVIRRLSFVVDRIKGIVVHRSGLSPAKPDKAQRTDAVHAPRKQERKHKRWTGRGYIRTGDKPDIMSVVIPDRKRR